MNVNELKESIKVLSKKYKDLKQDDLIYFLNYILKDKYDTKYYSLRMYNNLSKTKKIYLNFINDFGLEDLSKEVLFINSSLKYKESGIYDIDSNKKVVIILNNNTKDLFNLVRYSIILDQLNKKNDEVVSYIKSMLVEKKLLDYLKKIKYSNIECEKIKKYNLMEVLYISNIINCTLEEIKYYNQVLDINNNIFNQTELNIKKHIDNSELTKYDLLNSKKYIYGIIYSSYLHQTLTDIDILNFLNTSMNFNQFLELYIKDTNKEKILNNYNKEYRC